MSIVLQVELSFRTFSNDGLLVYGGSGGSGTDYFSIKLEDGHLVFEYELGGGPVVLKSAARYFLSSSQACICPDDKFLSDWFLIRSLGQIRSSNWSSSNKVVNLVVVDAFSFGNGIRFPSK